MTPKIQTPFLPATPHNLIPKLKSKSSLLFGRLVNGSRGIPYSPSAEHTIYRDATPNDYFSHEKSLPPLPVGALNSELPVPLREVSNLSCRGARSPHPAARRFREEGLCGSRLTTEREVLGGWGCPPETGLSEEQANSHDQLLVLDMGSATDRLDRVAEGKQSAERSTTLQTSRPSATHQSMALKDSVFPLDLDEFNDEWPSLAGGISTEGSPWSLSDLPFILRDIRSPDSPLQSHFPSRPDQPSLSERCQTGDTRRPSLTIRVPSFTVNPTIEVTQTPDAHADNPNPLGEPLGVQNTPQLSLELELVETAHSVMSARSWRVMQSQDGGVFIYHNGLNTAGGLSSGSFIRFELGDSPRGGCEEGRVVVEGRCDPTSAFPHSATIPIWGLEG